MKKILALLLAALMLAGALVSCTPADPVDTSDTDDTSDTVETTPAETEPPEKKEFSYDEEIVASYDGYTVTLSEPIVVYQGEEGDNTWGHTNFPKVGRTAEGYLRVWWRHGEDKVAATGTITCARVSADEGETWGDVKLHADVSTAAPDMLMPNGKCWGGFSPAGEPVSNELAAMIPDSEKVMLNSGHSLVLTEDLEQYDLAKELNLIDVSMQEYDPVTGTYETIPCTVNWPYKAVTIYPGNAFVAPARWFSMSSGSVVLTSDGTLYTAVYGLGFDADAATFEESVLAQTKAGKTFVYIFESTDCGRTWNYLAEFYTGREVKNWRNSEGYNEPDMIEMPDGSLFVVLRTGMTSPLYGSVSHDGGHTWSTPEEFDYCGVRPQLLGLDCGVTIASYGRPDLLVRTTDDPTGDTWDEHIEIPLVNTSPNYMQKSCFYTGLLEIDENSAWFCYTDFKYPNENGVRVKSVILRKITVTMDK